MAYVGDPVALVVARSRYIAEDAADLIEVEYDYEEPVLDYREAASLTDRLVHPEAGSNAMASVPFTPMSPDLDEAFDQADHVIEETIESHRYIAVPMEPRGVLADWDPGLEELNVVMSTQSVHESRAFCARMLDVPEANVTVSIARCRRRVRVQDAHRPGGGRDRPGVPPARPAGEVDRGPQGEPHLGTRTPATSGPESGSPSTPTGRSRPWLRTASATSAPTRRRPDRWTCSC